MAACFGAWQITTKTCFLLHKSLVCTQPQPAIQAAICHHGVSGVKADLKKNVATIRIRDAVGGLLAKVAHRCRRICRPLHNSQRLSPPQVVSAILSSTSGATLARAKKCNEDPAGIQSDVFVFASTCNKPHAGTEARLDKRQSPVGVSRISADRFANAQVPQFHASVDGSSEKQIVGWSGVRCEITGSVQG
jgi:hypothetical protein